MFEQLSMFEELDAESMLPPDKQKFRRSLRKGSGFQNGKERIKEHSKLPKKEFVDFLKKEYGIGGWSFEGGFIEHTSMHYYICERSFQNRTEYSWADVANEILDMIKTNSY